MQETLINRIKGFGGSLSDPSIFDVLVVTEKIVFTFIFDNTLRIKICDVAIGLGGDGLFLG